MTAYKLLSEDEQSVTVQTPDGSTRVLVKSGLSPETLGQVRGYSKGGTVKDEKEEELGIDIGEEPSSRIEMPEMDLRKTRRPGDRPKFRRARPGEDQNSDLIPYGNDVRDLWIPPEGVPTDRPYVTPSFPGASLIQQLTTAALPAAGGEPAMLPSHYVSPVAPPNPALTRGPDPSQAVSTLAGPAPAPGLQQVASPQTQALAAHGASPEPLPPSHGLMGAPGPEQQPAAPAVQARPASARAQGPDQLTLAQAQAERAYREQARLEGIQAEADLATQNWFMQRSAQLQEDFQKKYQTNIERAQQLYDGLLNSKIDPKRVWANASTGQKIAAAIAMALGGAGAAIANQPNLAVAVVQKAIDNDIDAQKMDLQNKHTMLSYHLQQGHDMVAAHQLAKADLLDATAAQLKKNSLQYGGEKAAAAVELQIADLRTNAMQLRQQMTAQSLDNALKREQITASQFSRLFMGAQVGLRQKVLSGQPLTPEEEMLVIGQPETIELPGGQLGMARTKEDAKEVRDIIQANASAQGVISDMRRMRAEQGRAWVPGKMGGYDAARSKSLQKALFAPLRMLYGLGVMSQFDIELLEAKVPDVGNITTSDAQVNAQLDQLQQEINDKLLGAIRARIIGQGQTPRVAPKTRAGR
jgi:hypothetical protein